jgi:hypothetical protein
MSNFSAALRNLASKLLRDSGRRLRRAARRAQTSGKDARSHIRSGRADARDAVQHAYAGTVKASRAFERWRLHVWERTAVEVSVRRELRQAARGSAPIIVGPWLGEVGYEALYWVPFVRWFVDQYRVDQERLVVVSRGGVGSWYSDLTDKYIEIFDLATPDDMRQANDRRRASGDQKQLTQLDFDQAILDQVRRRLGTHATVCHPSTMFRLLRRFWLGSESMQYVVDHTSYRLIPAGTAASCPPLPAAFVAVKFYSGRALPETAETRATLRTLLERVRQDRPIVVLDTGVTPDEHHDFGLFDMPDVHSLAEWLTPQNNLGVQTEVIRRAELFIGTCGSVAWLAPMLGTPTMAVYVDDHLLAPHLYAARQIYPTIGAASFIPLDLSAIAALSIDGMAVQRKAVAGMRPN